MDRITALQAYVRVVELESFTAAARDLRVAQSTVSKWVRALEEELDASLIERTSRALHVTPAGERFYAAAKGLLADWQDALDVAHPNQQVRGALRVSVPVVFGRRYVLPHVDAFVRAHPDVQLDLRFSDAYVNLVEQGVDVAIRVGRAVDSSFRAIRLGRTARHLVASPAYLARWGTPRSPQELAAHRALIHSGRSTATWTLTDPGGQAHTVSVQGRLRANHSEALLELARAGHGIAMLATWLVREAIHDGSLVPILADHALPDAPIRAVRPPSRETPLRVSAWLDHLREVWAAGGPGSPFFPS